MPTFDFLSLLWWGLPLATAPIIIHLINLLRHRKVQWAAMEFLLASQRKYRTRVLLKQILLLLLRVVAVLGIVLALAQPRLRSALGQMLGGTRTAHVVLLDDSYSMSDLSTGGRIGSVSAFDRGKLVVERICREIAGVQGRQELTIGRFSALTLAPPNFDVPRQTLTPQVVQEVCDELATWQPTANDCGPREPLVAAAEAVGAGTGATNVVWLVTDFRTCDWKVADETADLLQRLSDAGVELRLVDCAAGSLGKGSPVQSAGNLTIERLEVVGGVPATGVLVPLEVAVRNNSESTIRDVQVDLQEDGAIRPGLRLPEISAGAVAVQRFDARFTKPGSHVVDARIPSDVLAIDNVRTAVINVVDRVDVLIIDGDPRGGARAGDAFYLSAALAPGSGAPTGLRPRIEQPRALTALSLSAFDCIWLLDVERLDPPEIKALETFTRSGGGVVFFMGPRTKIDEVNRTLYRDGKGLFPLSLAGPVDLLVERDNQQSVPDVIVEEHPVVAVLNGQRNPLLDAVRIDRFMAVDRDFTNSSTGVPSHSRVRRLLSLRTRAPLIVERPYGEGLVVAVLTTASPNWNNWARANPSWVVVMLELESHLARIRRQAETLEVGDAVTVSLEAGNDEIDVDFIVPPGGTIIHQTAVVTPTGSLAASLSTTHSAGAYAARWRRLDGTQREQIVAVNVDPDEGRLERIGREQLDQTLAGVTFQYDNAESLQPDANILAGVSLVTPLLHALLLVLLLEQLLAYFSSYHAAIARKSRPSL